MRPRTRLPLGRTLAAALALAAALFCPVASEAQGEASRERWQRVPDILSAMNVQPGAVVADIGAGDGFFTVRLARAVGDQGRVHAVDISEAQLGRLRTRIEKEGLRNVSIVHGSVDDPRLEPGTLDAALIVNAYHEMTEHQAILRRIKAALKPEGRLVIVEPISDSRRGATRQDQVAKHEIAVEHVEREAREAEFHVTRLEDPFTDRGTNVEWLLVLTAHAPSRPR